MIKDLIVDRSALDRIIAGRRLRLGVDRQRSRRQRHPGPEAGRRAGHGRRRLHRLRGLRRGLPQRLGHALHRREGVAAGAPAAGAAGALPSRAQDGGGDGRRGLRQLHEPRRVRGRLPEGHQARHHRPDEPRLPEGDPDGRRGVDGRGRGEPRLPSSGARGSQPWRTSPRYQLLERRLAPQRPHHRVDGEDARSRGPARSAATARSSSARFVSPSARWTVAAW